MSRAFRLKLLLAIDTAFLVLELGVGTAVGSLALVADSFHILLVAMQAMKLAEKEATAKYSYGWQRAEVLGALINSVFLLALCFSIGMEAIARLVNDTEVTNPKLIVVVGSAGLLSNIVGLFLFHDHGGHSHGGGGGHTHGGHGHSHVSGSHTQTKHRSTQPPKTALNGHSPGQEHDERTPLLKSPSPSPRPDTPSGSSTATDFESTSEERAEDELFVHPGELRGNIVRAAHHAGYGAQTQSVHRTRASTSSEHEHSHDDSAGHAHDFGPEDEHGADANHASAEGSMNMRGVFLHVLGDALGNVGVIAAGLFIWLTEYKWRMYSDPAISLVITCIIFSSALPLAKSASFILLQGVPSSIPLDRLRSAIAAIPGVLNVHELHVWSLSESKSVASVHVMTNGTEFVEVSSKIRRVMHRFGIHSS
ncbi:Zinc resistance conferring protein [Microbotryomycetes sp. JL201]|nr:Zinc resistance conferring protein [Microbotryomycetes sp. JL201]